MINLKPIDFVVCIGIALLLIIIFLILPPLKPELTIDNILLQFHCKSVGSFHIADLSVNEQKISMCDNNMVIITPEDNKNDRNQTINKN